MKTSRIDWRARWYKPDGYWSIGARKRIRTLFFNMEYHHADRLSRKTTGTNQTVATMYRNGME